MEKLNELELVAHKIRSEDYGRFVSKLTLILDSSGKKIGESTSKEEEDPSWRKVRPQFPVTTLWRDYFYCLQGGISARVTTLYHDSPTKVIPNTVSFFVHLASYVSPVQEVANRIKEVCPEFEEEPIKYR